MNYIARLVCVASASLVIAACTAAPASPPPPAAAKAPEVNPVDRGKYIVNTAGCHDCHTPMKMGPNGPEPDMARMLSGHPEAVKVTKPFQTQGDYIAGVNATGTAWSGPWGISYTMNLTPDQNTGIGIWTEGMFVKAIRTGKHMGTDTSRDILPPMPWQMYRNLTDDDLKAVYAYLRTIPPVTNHVPDPIAPAPAKK
jgi:mono/diheme cytochrome c family protein